MSTDTVAEAEHTCSTQIASKGLKKHCKYCCVLGCNNNSKNSPTLKFYLFPTSNRNFPHKRKRREEWIKVVRFKNADHSPMPGKYTRICSQHFAGNRKLEDPTSPSYIPSIFPYKKSRKDSEAEVARYKRALKRRLKDPLNVRLYKLNVSKNLHSNIENRGLKRKNDQSLENINKKCIGLSSQLSAPSNFIDENLSIINSNSMEKSECIVHSDACEGISDSYEQFNVGKVDASCQVDIYQDNQDEKIVIISNRFIYPETCDVETQVNSPLVPKEKVINTNMESEYKFKGFIGIDSIKTDEELNELTGVTFNDFITSSTL